MLTDWKGKAKGWAEGVSEEEEEEEIFAAVSGELGRESSVGLRLVKNREAKGRVRGRERVVKLKLRELRVQARCLRKWPPDISEVEAGREYTAVVFEARKRLISCAFVYGIYI